MSAGNGGRVVRVPPQAFETLVENVTAGREDVHLPAELVTRAIALKDGGPVTLAIVQGLLRGLVRTAPPPVAAVLQEAVDGITAGMDALEVDG